jgi:hypothetical protein
MIRVKVISALDENETLPQKKARMRRNQHRTGRKQYPSDDPSHMSRNDRLDAIFPGYEDQRKLAKGIAEEKKKPVSKKTGRREACVAGNQDHRGSDGRFTDGTDAGGSWSIGADERYASKERRTGCARGQAKRSGKKQTWTKVPCGRRGRKSIGGKKPTYIRCHDGKKVVPGKKQVDESSVKVPVNALQDVDVDRLILSLRRKQDKITALEKALRQLRKNGCKKQMSVEQLAVAVDAVQRATKGKLNDPE